MALESPTAKIEREFDLAGQGFAGFTDAAREAFTNKKTETLLEAGGAAAVGVGLALVNRIPGVGVPVGLAITAGLVGSSVIGLAENGSRTLDAFVDTWRSSDHEQQNNAIVRHDLGQFAFDSVVMSAAGGLSTGLLRRSGLSIFAASQQQASGIESVALGRGAMHAPGPIQSAPAALKIGSPATDLVEDFRPGTAPAAGLAVPGLIHNKIEIDPALPNDEVRKALQFQRDTSENSPWLRTMSNFEPLPTLQGHTEADVVVIGSGVVGQQIAYRLAALGKKVVVLEANTVGSGTSSMMGAMNTVVPDTGFGPMLEKLGPGKFAEMMRRMLAGRSSVEQLGRKYGDFRPVNSYNVAYSENNADVLSEAALLRQFDPRVRFVNGKEAQAIFPLARSAAILPNEGNVNPLKMLNGMARSGMYKVFEHSPVEAVAPTTDGAMVFTTKGTVHAKERVIVATNNPTTPFGDANQHLTPVQTFSNIANIGRRMPGNYFDAPDQSQGKVPFSYWRQFGLPQFKPDETLIGGTAHFLHDGKAVPFEPELPIVTSKLFNGAKGRNQSTAVIWTDYDWGLPLYYRHPKYKSISAALGAGGNGLNGGALLAQAAEKEASGHTDELLLPQRSN